MPAIYLVRHAQSSFDTDDYDRLSELGARQCEALAEAMALRGVVPGVLVTGRMRRHQQTAELVAGKAGWHVRAEMNGAFDEYDHDAVLCAGLRSFEMTADGWRGGASRLQIHADTMRQAARGWALGEISSADETFGQFRQRVVDGATALARRLRSGEDCVVFTSGGPIAALVSLLLGGDGRTWFQLDRATVTTGVTVIAVGKSGLSMVSFNEHGHLPAELRVYR